MAKEPHPPSKTDWVEYSDSLEDSLTEAKEYAAALESKAERTQSALMTKIEPAMDQNTKLLALKAKGGFSSPKDDGKSKEQHRCGGQRGKKEPRVCNNCKDECYHEDDDCFKLEENKAQRPKWYIKKYGE